MPRSLTELRANLLNFGKQASADPTTATDPTEAGGPATPSSENLREENGVTTPPGNTAVPTIATMTDGSGASAPATQDFVEPGKLANDFQATAQALREKLASGLWNPAAQAAPAKAAAQAPAAQAAPQKAASAPGSIHLKIAAHLMETENGRMQVTEALTEVLGKEAAAELVRSGHGEQQQFERSYLEEKLAAAELAEKYASAYAERVELELQSEELIKQATAGMSGPEIQNYREKIATSAQIIQRAEATFAQHPQAHADFTYGVLCADKYASAVEAGMDPAAMDPAAGGMPPEGDPAASGMPPEGGGEAPPSPEEIQQALIELIQAGVITEEQAEQLLQAVAGGAGGAPPEGDPAAGGMPPEEAMPPEKAAAIDDHLSKVAAAIIS